jgi:hypothetical protein
MPMPMPMPAPEPTPTPTPTGPDIVPALIAPEVFTPLKDFNGAHDALCANDGQHPNFPDDADLITKTFCADKRKGGGTIPTPHSLKDLQAQLGLAFTNVNGGNGVNGNPAFALMGHSSSLVSRFVSAFNPRAIVFTPPPADGSKPVGYAILAFTRGEHFAEVAVHDPTLDVVNFYLVRFTQDCDTQPGGCTPGQLITPEVEKNWGVVTVYESSTEINNTVVDCLQCHQPDGPSGPKILRMQERTAPYTHFFSSQTVGGRQLLADFHAAHGTTEDYGPIPASMIDKSDPSLLARFVFQSGFSTQPNYFNSSLIESEVRLSAKGQPQINVPPGRSATWQAIYDQAKSGRFIAVPYHDVKVTDPDKLSNATSIYQQLLAGMTQPSAVPDLRDVFLTQGLSDMGFAPASGLDGRSLLVQMCQQCHNGRLDQTLTRARFNVEQLDQLSRDEKDQAIQRLMLDASSSKRMPPPALRTASTAERQLMINELMR